MTQGKAPKSEMLDQQNLQNPLAFFEGFELETTRRCLEMNVDAHGWLYVNMHTCISTRTVCRPKENWSCLHTAEIDVINSNSEPDGGTAVM